MAKSGEKLTSLFSHKTLDEAWLSMNPERHDDGNDEAAITFEQLLSWHKEHYPGIHNKHIQNLENESLRPPPGSLPRASVPSLQAASLAAKSKGTELKCDVVPTISTHDIQINSALQCASKVDATERSKDEDISLAPSLALTPLPRELSTWEKHMADKELRRAKVRAIEKAHAQTALTAAKLQDDVQEKSVRSEKLRTNAEERFRIGLERIDSKHLAMGFHGVSKKDCASSAVSKSKHQTENNAHSRTPPRPPVDPKMTPIQLSKSRDAPKPEPSLASLRGIPLGGRKSSQSFPLGLPLQGLGNSVDSSPPGKWGVLTRLQRLRTSGDIHQRHPRVAPHPVYSAEQVQSRESSLVILQKARVKAFFRSVQSIPMDAVAAADAALAVKSAVLREKLDSEKGGTRIEAQLRKTLRERAQLAQNRRNQIIKKCIATDLKAKHAAAKLLQGLFRRVAKKPWWQKEGLQHSYPHDLKVFSHSFGENFDAVVNTPGTTTIPINEEVPENDHKRWTGEKSADEKESAEQLESIVDTAEKSKDFVGNSAASNITVPSPVGVNESKTDKYKIGKRDFQRADRFLQHHPAYAGNVDVHASNRHHRQTPARQLYSIEDGGSQREHGLILPPPGLPPPFSVTRGMSTGNGAQNRVSFISPHRKDMAVGFTESRPREFAGSSQLSTISMGNASTKMSLETSERLRAEAAEREKRNQNYKDLKGMLQSTSGTLAWDPIESLYESDSVETIDLQQKSMTRSSARDWASAREIRTKAWKASEFRKRGKRGYRKQ
jgi:hypothetical protein